MTAMHVMLQALLILIVLVMSTGSLGSVNKIFAQEITIETSADEHGNQFFGEAVLRVVVIDPNTDDSTLDDIEVKIEAHPDQGGSNSIDVVVPETNDGSGKFEFFITHVSANKVSPVDLDAINSAGVEDDGICPADCAPLVTFGPGGDLEIDSGLYEDVRFEIQTGDTETEVSYEDTTGSLTLDRSSYGTTSFVYISIMDQDANLNPRDRDQFSVDPELNPNRDLLELDGGLFEGEVMFTETGDNTSVFKGRYRLGMSILVNTEALVLTLHEKANYNDTLSAVENNSNEIDRLSFTVGNTDGSIDVGEGSQTDPTWDPVIITDKDSYSSSDDTVNVTITDQDANENTNLADSVQLAVSSGRSSIEITALETGFNTGVFEASITLGEENSSPATIVPGGFATITYTDRRPADYFEKVQAGEDPEKDFTHEIDIQLPVRTGIDSTEVTAPRPMDVTGGGFPLSVGSSATIATTIYNNNEFEQPFVAIIEVRDSEGVTLYLALQSGILEPNGATEVGVLWIPERAGTYEVRTFTFTDISGEAELLSTPASSKITIS